MHLRSKRQYTLQGMENRRESICILLVSQTSPQLTSHIVVTQPWVLDHCQQWICTCVQIRKKYLYISFSTKVQPSLEYQDSQLCSLILQFVFTCGITGFLVSNFWYLSGHKLLINDFMYFYFHFLFNRLYRNVSCSI